MEVKSAKINGESVKLVIMNSLTKIEEGVIISCIKNTYRHSDYLVVPVKELRGELNIKETIREILVENVEPNEIHTNGSYFIKSSQLLEKITTAQNTQELGTIYSDFSFSFTKI